MNTPQKRNMMVYGGSVCLGRYQNIMTDLIRVEKVLAGLDLFKSADFSLVNLECVVSAQGVLGYKKNERAPYYFRARPEMLNILHTAGIDCVSLANNHSGDYGPEALMDTLSYLDKANISFIGAGANALAAQMPKFFAVGDVTIGLFAIDMTQSTFAAGDTSAGSYYLDPRRFEDWMSLFQKQIEATKPQCDLVFLKVHWGRNFETGPTDHIRAMAKSLIRSGIDAILGSSAHILHGVEIIDQKPVIYDAGNLLFDFRYEKQIGGVFQLFLTRNGVEEIRLIPVNNGYCYATYASKEQGAKALGVFSERCNLLGTHVNTQKGPGQIFMSPPPKEPKTIPIKLSREKRVTLPTRPIKQPLSSWLRDSVPDYIEPKQERFGPLCFLGLHQSHNEVHHYEPVKMESYWRLVDTETPENFLIVMRFVPKEQHDKSSFWEADHEPCDWQWPTSRWKKGQIYYDQYFIRPPDYENLCQGSHDLIIGVTDLKSKESFIKRIDDAITVTYQR